MIKACRLRNYRTKSMPLIIQSAIGFLAIFVIAWCFAERRWAISWRSVIAAIVLQVVIGVLLFNFPQFKTASLWLNRGLDALQAATLEGTKLLFGYLGGDALPFALLEGKSSFVLAIQTLPVIIVISALSSLLFYWRVLPMLVKVFSWCLRRTLGIGGALGLSASANVFLGPVESPMVVRPYLTSLSRGELFAVMSAGMAGIAGTMMAIYAFALKAYIPDAIGHIVVVSFISIPAVLAISALMVPHEGPATESNDVDAVQMQSSMDAITRGTLDGVQTLISIIAMVLVATALITIANQVLYFLPNVADAPITLQRTFGWIMAPLMVLIGIPTSEAMTAGSLMGTKTVLNEYLAYLQMTNLEPGQLSPRSQVMMLYALCGFANFGSLGIMIGGLSTLCPERRNDIISLGYRSIIAGTLATLSCAALVGVLYRV
jgi:concentrative nucleoside transporter, CNT family